QAEDGIRDNHTSRGLGDVYKRQPKRLTVPSDLSATPQTPCLSAFRLKDMHCEMFQPENILQEKRFPKNRRKISSAETFQPPTEGFLNPILQPECPRVGRLRAG
ncbi:hypothetical protein PL679_12605, partial [Phocaeicola vulgatus]|nr:hypothetical protein [Phocaeicola vulgatus]